MHGGYFEDIYMYTCMMYVMSLSILHKIYDLYKNVYVDGCMSLEVSPRISQAPSGGSSHLDT